MTAAQSPNSPESPWDDPRWFRQAAADVTAMLLRVYGAHQLDVVEDAVQDAFIAAVRTWPHTGVPDNATGWLVHVARNRLRDGHRRSQHAQTLAQRLAATNEHSTPPDILETIAPASDDQLQLLFACCHPSLSPESRVALTLKTVAQLSVDEIARALHADARAVAQRVVRAKKTLRDARAEWRMPEPNELPSRLGDVLNVCYAMFSEGHSATDGDVIVRNDLCLEAIRLLECLIQTPATATPEVHALLALCCFVAARTPARVPVAGLAHAGDESGEWISLAKQDRSRWNHALIARGYRAFDRAAAGETVSRYHIEAEIAAMHSLAPSYHETPWAAIIAAYDRLLTIVPSRAVELSRAIAVAESGDVEQAWADLDRLGLDDRAHDWPNWLAARAELAERRGAWRIARESYDRALTLVLPDPVRQYLQKRRDALHEGG